MPEILVNSNTLPFGEDYGDQRECIHDAMTLNEVSGAAVLVTPHTHSPGEPSLAHSLMDDGTRDRAIPHALTSKQDWPRRRRVDSAPHTPR